MSTSLKITILLSILTIVSIITYVYQRDNFSFMLALVSGLFTLFVAAICLISKVVTYIKRKYSIKCSDTQIWTVLGITSLLIMVVIFSSFYTLLAMVLIIFISCIIIIPIANKVESIIRPLAESALSPKALAKSRRESPVSSGIVILILRLIRYWDLLSWEKKVIALFVIYGTSLIVGKLRVIFNS